MDKRWWTILLLFFLVALLLQYVAEPLLLDKRISGMLTYGGNFYIVLWIYWGFAFGKWHSTWKD